MQMPNLKTIVSTISITIGSASIIFVGYEIFNVIMSANPITQFITATGLGIGGLTLFVLSVKKVE